MRPLPSVMRPEVVLRCPTNRFLEHLEELSCQCIFLQLSWRITHPLESTDILPPFRSFHIDIEHRIVHFPYDSLCAGKHRRVMIQERQPQMDILPLRILISDIAEQRHPLLLSVFSQIAKNLLLGDTSTLFLLS